MKPRTKAQLLTLLLLLGVLYRLFAAYPLDLGRFAPASSALQAMHILGGERPIFYSGQAWMGPAGAYLIAAMFKGLGASTLTLGLFSWVMSVLFLLGTVRLAHRLFGVDNALVVAALFLVPIDEVMHLASQPRAHYTITFVLVPAVFLSALALLRRHRAGRRLPAAAFFFGLLCGFTFWTNMAIGPAIGAAMLLLLWHLRRDFFTRLLASWTGGWVVGFAPVIWYNLTNQAILLNQVGGGTARPLGRVLRAFATNAWPRFWGIHLEQALNPAVRALFVALLLWIALLFLWMPVQGWLKSRRGEDVVGYQLVYGYLVLHLAVTASSHYGIRFETSTPLSYIVTLYAVAFCVPALVLQSGLSRRVQLLALLPLGLFIANNLFATAVYPKRFAAAVREQGFTRVTRYPNKDNLFLQVCRQRGLSAGYLGRAFRGDSAKYQNFPLNLECYGNVTFADPSSERYVASALTVDAAREIFWVGADANSLRMIGATFRSEPVVSWDFFSEFRKEQRELTVIQGRPAGGSKGGSGVALVSDLDHDTVWSASLAEIPGAVLEFEFAVPEKLREVVIVPADASRSPGAVIVEVSDDSAVWRPAGGATDALPMFWSVWHPFLKVVKPRLEIALPEAAAGRFCRLRFAGSRNRDGVAIREVQLLRDGPAIDPAAWEREIDDVVQGVRELGRGAVVVGDHWFVNFFRQEGLATDYISNEAILDTGMLNPNLEAPVPLDFSRANLLIVPRTYLSRVEELLRVSGVSSTATPLRHHVLLLTAPAAAGRSLSWNGLELNRVKAQARRQRAAARSAEE